MVNMNSICAVLHLGGQDMGDVDSQSAEGNNLGEV